MNKERAYVQLISKLLGVEFDAIWQRHRRLLVQKLIAWTIGIIVIFAALGGAWAINQPVDVAIRLNEVSVHNDNLPPLKDAIVTLTLSNEIKTDTIRSIEANSLFANIPHRYVGKEVRVTFICQDFLPLDTFVLLSKQIVIPVRRNEKTYGQVHMQFWNPLTETLIEGVEVCVDGQKSISDHDGFVAFFVPLERQRESYSVLSSIAIQHDTIRPWTEGCSIPTLLLKE